VQRRLIYLTTILSIFLSIIGCTPTYLKDYEPKSLDEEAIVSVLSKFEKARSSEDIEGVLALWHDDAKILYGSGRFTTKPEYKVILAEQMRIFPNITFTGPSVIDVSGNVAKVKTWISARGGPGGLCKGPTTINLVKENNQWLLMSWRF
jgi:ketosteroid isomerase-like protein